MVLIVNRNKSCVHVSENNQRKLSSKAKHTKYCWIMKFPFHYSLDILVIDVQTGNDVARFTNWLIWEMLSYKTNGSRFIPDLFQHQTVICLKLRVWYETVSCISVLSDLFRTSFQLSLNDLEALISYLIAVFIWQKWKPCLAHYCPH